MNTPDIPEHSDLSKSELECLVTGYLMCVSGNLIKDDANFEKTMHVLTRSIQQLLNKKQNIQLDIFDCLNRTLNVDTIKMIATVESTLRIYRSLKPYRMEDYK
jgi:hypothetical protein